MILIIDHFDSFVQTLARYIREADMAVRVTRQNEIDVEAICADLPDAVILSPGPGTPDGAGASLPLVRALGGRVPILGVCLGHQIIAQNYGARVCPAPRPAHGKQARIAHHGTDIFDGLPNPMLVGRYHSLAIDALPDCLQAIATLDETPDKTIMAIKHKTHPIWGVQFHPESILTPDGRRLISNFLGAL